jgi:rhodanese-related sulfurtransferase
MKKQAILLIAVSLFLLVVAGAGIASTDHLSAQSVAPRDFKRMLDRHHDSSDLVLLDVRTPREFAAGHIQGAVLMDVYARDLAERLDTLDRNKTYLIYCLSGNRSAKRLALFNQLGFMHAYHLDTGIRGWLRERYPVVR